MKKEYKYRMIFGAIVLLAAIALQISQPSISPMLLQILITGGIVLIAVSAVRHMKYKEGPEKDERTKKISAFALGYSWIVTLVLVCILFLSNEYSILKLTVTQALGSIMFVMIATLILFQWHLKRRGDVE